MGNYASCALAGANGKQSKGAKIGRRFSALNADDDLEIGNVYVMFPMQRVNSFVNATDMGAIFLAAKRGAGKVRVVPACSGEVMETESPASDDGACGMGLGSEGMVDLCLPEFQQRRSVCRSRKPVLETIVEEPICSM